MFDKYDSQADYNYGSVSITKGVFLIVITIKSIKIIFHSYSPAKMCPLNIEGSKVETKVSVRKFKFLCKWTFFTDHLC